jgi:UDP-glucose:(heptosyl)LPS alpha-1,3-glucosyltransferase
MRIAIVIGHCRNFKSSRYVIEITKYFCEQGHEVHLFTNSWDDLDDRVIVHKIPMISKNFQIREISFIIFTSISMLFRKFDIKLSQASRYFSPNICEMQFVYKRWAELKRENKHKININDLFVPLMEKYNLSRCEKVIAISDIVKEEIIDLHKINPGKINVVHSGANLEFFNPDKRKFRKKILEKHNIDPREAVIIFVGNPFGRKGLDYAIKALPKIKYNNFKFLVIGKDDKKPYLELAKKLGVEDKIVFAGLTTEINKYFASSDIFLFPTLYEPFGLVILEAMASGIPVITSKTAGAAELIDDMKNGMILDDPTDYNKITEKLNYLLENRERLRKIGKEARKKAEKYSWNTTAKKMLTVFKKVARVNK